MGKHYLVYIVDDDVVIGFLTRKLFELKGYRNIRFECYSSCSQALKVLNNANDSKDVLPDLIMLDINLPGENGWDFLEKLKLNPNCDLLPVVIFSSSVDPRDMEKSQSWMPIVRDFISKPLNSGNYERLLKIISYDHHS